MFRKIEDFLMVWSDESEATLKILNAIPDDVFDKPITGYNKTLCSLAWHLVTCIVSLANMIGLKVDGPGSEIPPPKKISELANTYKKVSDVFVSEIKTKWNDDSLNIENNMFGTSWKNGATLFTIVTHQIHHRGQMTALMRILGLKTVPGVYGPSKEEMAAFNMEAQP
jgi:uncharacterized damage-inducible protein DinB